MRLQYGLLPVSVAAVSRPSGVPAVRGLVRAGFRRTSSYRLATAAGVFTNTVFGIIKISILLAAARAGGGSVAGYDRAGLSSYTWISQGMIAVVFLLGGTTVDVAERVRTGDIVIDLSRPLHPLVAWGADDLGGALAGATWRLALPLAFGAAVYGLHTPTRAATVPLAVLSIALAWLVSFGLRVLVDLATFWLLDVRGLTTLYIAAVNVLGGLIVPVAFLPGWLGIVAHATPFPSMLQTTVDVAVERGSTLRAVALIGVQAGWAAVVLALAAVVLHRAFARLVVQGG